MASTFMLSTRSWKNVSGNSPCRAKQVRCGSRLLSKCSDLPGFRLEASAIHQLNSCAYGRGHPRKVGGWMSTSALFISSVGLSGCINGCSPHCDCLPAASVGHPQQTLLRTAAGWPAAELVPPWRAAAGTGLRALSAASCCRSRGLLSPLVQACPRSACHIKRSSHSTDTPRHMCRCLSTAHMDGRPAAAHSLAQARRCYALAEGVLYAVLHTKA